MMPTPSRLDLVDEREELLGLAVGQRRGRLVEDEHREVGAESLGDLDHLLLGAGELLDPAFGPEREAEPRDDLAGAGADGALVEDAAAHDLGAEEEVLLDRHLRDEREFLEHGGDAERPRLVDRVDVDRRAAEADLAAGRLAGPRRGSRSASTCRRRSRRRGRALRPARSVKSTRSSASTPGYCLLIPTVSRRGAAPVSEPPSGLSSAAVMPVSRSRSRNSRVTRPGRSA